MKQRDRKRVKEMFKRALVLLHHYCAGQCSLLILSLDLIFYGSDGNSTRMSALLCDKLCTQGHISGQASCDDFIGEQPLFLFMSLRSLGNHKSSSSLFIDYSICPTLSTHLHKIHKVFFHMTIDLYINPPQGNA